MKQQRLKFKLLALILFGMFALLAVYGGYSISTYGNRWFASNKNPRVRTQKDNVTAGNVLDTNGIILATSVLGTYAGTNTLLANRIVILSFIYCVFIMPMTYQGLRNSLYAVNTRGLLEAAEMLGARRFHSFLTIVVPAILPGLCNSALMCLSGLFGDFAIIKIIASSQFETAQSYLYRNRAQDTQELSAAVVILLLITLLINYLVHKSQDPADRVS